MKRLTIANLIAMAARVYRRFSSRLLSRGAHRIHGQDSIASPEIVRPPEPQPPSLPQEPEPAPAAGATIWATGYKQNREERRRLERARRRKDKFVKPIGAVPPPPPKPESPPPIAKPKTMPTIVEQVHDAELIFADHHHTDEALVLYREGEVYGEFYFRDTILDQLDRYFVYLRRMRAKSPDDYDLYRQIGAVILPYAAVPLHFAWSRKKEEKEPSDPELPIWFNKHRPTFGCFVYGADPHTEQIELEESVRGRHGLKLWYPRFMSITKYDRPPLSIEPANGDGDVYKMSIWWDRPQDLNYKRGESSQQDFAVFIGRDGKTMRVLRQMDYSMVRIFSKRKHEWFKIPHRGFAIPNQYVRWAREHECDVQKYLLCVFCSAVGHLETAGYSMVRVTATKGHLAAVFGVNIKRMGYFFQDRDVTLSGQGIRKRIFHIVRAHTRKDGRSVPFHFRGERSFEWAGYHIDITVPGREHLNPAEINFGLIGDVNKKEARQMVTSAVFGKLIADNIKKAASQPAR